MNHKTSSNKYLKTNHLVWLVSLFVGFYGLYIIFSTLHDQLAFHRLILTNGFIIDVHLLLGVSFIYLSTLLIRKKRNALFAAIAALIFLIGEGTNEVLIRHRFSHVSLIIFLRYIVVPILGVVVLFIARDSFKVKSDQVAYRNSIKLAIIVFMVAMIYGVVGFMLMDKSDFHQEISFLSAIHHTLSQLNFFGSNTLTAYTHRAKLFLDSLSFVSLISVIYVGISFFVPVKARLNDQTVNRLKVLKLMEYYGADSEDYFKLWPQDKYYYFADNEDAALAYGVKKGVALVLADPVGNTASFKQLIVNFVDMAWSNDWQVSLVHVSDQYLDFYKDLGFKTQLIGQEAKLDIAHFINNVNKNKYFRNINNRFAKMGYQVVFYSPPYNDDFIAKLKDISNDWLSKPGRAERGFVMGYFSSQYIQNCQIAVLLDSQKKFIAFINLIPSSSFNTTEMTYDMLRTASEAPANSSDYLICGVISELFAKGYSYFNMGLSPLVGLEESSDDQNMLITRVMKFAYINGDRFYSFKGLFRFKDKYDPQWENRYLLYKGGVRSFSKVLNGLLAIMKTKGS